MNDQRTLEELDRHTPPAAFDNPEEIKDPRARASVSRIGFQELSGKFGASSAEAADLIGPASDAGLAVEGLAFHVGSSARILRTVSRRSRPQLRSSKKRGRAGMP